MDYCASYTLSMSDFTISKWQHERETSGGLLGSDDQSASLRTAANPANDGLVDIVHPLMRLKQ